MKKHKMKKKFGQNFLKDKNLLKKIVREANINNKDVIEIGPGQGALTNFLAEEANSVTAYEIDYSLKPYLNILEENNKNLKVIYKDILSIDIPNDMEYHVVANIPYNITSPIIFKIIDCKNIKSATLMVQKEVADRITSAPKNKAYNALSVIIQYYMEVERIMTVKKHMFTPPPKVDSAVFQMIRKPQILEDQEEKLFIEIVKASFAQKRKTIVNNLTHYFKISKNILNDFFEGIEINKMARAESITLEEFILITKEWKNI